jgi:hypothetical protein
LVVVQLLPLRACVRTAAPSPRTNAHTPLPFPPKLQSPTHARTCERLLPKQALRGAVELLDELAGQQPRGLDLHPLADAKPHEAQLEAQ